MDCAGSATGIIATAVDVPEHVLHKVIGIKDHLQPTNGVHGHDQVGLVTDGCRVHIIRGGVLHHQARVVVIVKIHCHHAAMMWYICMDVLTGRTILSRDA